MGRGQFSWFQSCRACLFSWPGFDSFAPLFLPFHPGLQSNLLSFPQQQSSLLLPQTGLGLASQVNTHVLPVSAPDRVKLLGFPHPLYGTLTPLGRGNREGLSQSARGQIQATARGNEGPSITGGARIRSQRFQLPG